MAEIFSLINPYATADGRWLLLVASPPHWPGLANVIGNPELLEDPLKELITALSRT
jgi:crotonobetainyl-CoA:carnitine CoA-transferase CaiB-like acyl-CoA transferase